MSGGRTLRRVPLDFGWPVDQTWKGFLNPHCPSTCLDCDGSGVNPETKQIADDYYDHDGFGNRWRYEYYVAPDGTPAEHPPWRIIGECRAWHADITQDEVDALVEAGRLMDFTHYFVRGEGWKPRSLNCQGFWCPECRHKERKEEPGDFGLLCEKCGTQMEILLGDDVRLHIPTPEQVNEWERRGGLGGHDAINRWILIETRAKRRGLYGLCDRCGGEGDLFHSEEHKRRYEEWKESDPPSGAGYQLWETVSEGSPISPVFPSRLSLAKWCAEHTTICGDETVSTAQWYKMFLRDGGVDMGSTMVGFHTPDGRSYVGSEAKATEFVIAA